MLKLDVKFMRATFVLFALSWFVGDFMGNYGDDFKYVFWVFSIICSICPIFYYLLGYKKREKKKWDTYTLKYTMLVVVVFAVISVCAMPFNGFHLLMWKDLFYLALPGIYCFIIINIDDSDNFDFYMNVIFAGFVTNFILIATPSSFTLANFQSMSFADSYSPWESGLADMYGICFFYFYTRKKPKRAIVSFILSFLSFKRLNVIYMLLYLVIEPFLKNKPVPKWLEWTAKIGLIISPLFIYAATSDSFATWFEMQFGMNLNSFTMGRFNQINMISDLNENMNGLGMTHYMLEKYDFDIHRLHCDILRILIETTVVGLAVFVNSYINIARRNQKSFSLMLFFLIVMVSSTCMENVLYWAMIFLCFESLERVERRKEEREHELQAAKS